ncbi:MULTISPECIES: cytochrome P450 [Kitasatospora]|uniref:cytochrome P450 n=1 Tax=Kitasatospora TaxID=2063 RepID=UPI0009DFBF47|nr:MULTISPECIES: cytochrome P450 [Kitasatospora]
MSGATAGPVGTEDAGGLLRSALAACGSDHPAGPYPALAALRATAPVLYSAEVGTHFLTAFADCQAVLSGPAFAVPDRAWMLRERPAWAAHPAADFFYASLLGTDAAAHERLRAPLAAAFGPRRVAGLTAAVEKIADELLDALADALDGGATADFQALVGYPLPVAVVGELIGVPRADQAAFHRLGRDAARLLEPVRTEEDWRLADAAVTELRAYFAALLRARRTRPAEDLASDLLAGASGPSGERPLREDELADLLLLVFVAGFETTAGLLGTAAHTLLTHPDQAALLRADPGLLPGAVEEVLRWDGPVLMTERLARHPVEVGGVAVPAGGSLTAVLGAANRDPARHPDPDAFLVRRTGTRVLSFSAGPHYCLGAALARLEGALLLGRLLDRFPRLALAGTPTRRASACLRSFDALPLAHGT